VLPFSVALPAGPLALPAGPLALPARPDAMPASPDAMPASPVALPVGPVALPAGASSLPAGPNARPDGPDVLLGTMLKLLAAPVSLLLVPVPLPLDLIPEPDWVLVVEWRVIVVTDSCIGLTPTLPLGVVKGLPGAFGPWCVFASAVPAADKAKHIAAAVIAPVITTLRVHARCWMLCLPTMSPLCNK
jgi:hypothetical protein